MAAVDYFLKLDGVDGESTDSQHKNEIELESWSWGESNMGSSHVIGSGSGAGKVSMQDFHFTTKTNKSTPKLMLACATGQHIKKATLVVRKAGGDQVEYLIITMSDMIISSYQIGGSTGDIIPTDQCSINFSKIEFEYKPQDSTGKVGSPVKTGFDLKQYKKV